MAFLGVAIKMPKAISITLLVNMVRHLKFMIMIGLAHLGVLKLNPYPYPYPGEEDEEAFSNSNNYVLMLDGSSPSLVPIPIDVVTAAIKKRLPVLRYGEYLEKRIHDDEEEEKEEEACSVCLDSIESSHEMRELSNCCHVFHRECLDHWVDEGQVTCPLCRSMLLPLPLLPGERDHI